MAYFFKIKDMLIDTQSVQTISRKGKTITVVSTAGINTVEYENDQEAERQFNIISEAIKNNT